jgi:hypothetical protein
MVGKPPGGQKLEILGVGIKGISVVTGLIIAVTGLITALAALGVFSPAHSAALGGKRTPSAPTGPSSSAPTTPTGGQAAAVYWHGKVGITGPGINFDLKPATTSTNAPPTNISYTGSALENAWEPSPGIVISQWTQSSKPSESQCRTLVATHPSTVVNNVVTGMQICIKTAQGRYGRLTINSGATSDQLPATATIWDF